MTDVNVHAPGADQHTAEHSVADYQVQRLLGVGNNGRVLLARPPQRLRSAAEFVAVKVFDGQCSDAAYERCVEELRAVAATEAVYLVDVVEAGLDADSLYVAMDYVGGLPSSWTQRSSGDRHRAGPATSGPWERHCIGRSRASASTGNCRTTNRWWPSAG